MRHRDPDRLLGVTDVASHHCPPGGDFHHEETGMPPTPIRNCPAIRSALVPSVILALLLAAGCGSSTGGDMAKVDPKQQKELNKLLTEDYGQMYREKYQKQSKTSKAK